MFALNLPVLPSIEFKSPSYITLIPPARLGSWKECDRRMDNAIKYSPPGSKVEVEVKCFGDEIEIDVKDEGGGIPADVQELRRALG
jgi:hypothetical protein